jgi:DNA-binding IclR family transcriptional regulator
MKSSRDITKDPTDNGIRVIGRAAQILNALSKHIDGLTLGEIALQVNLPRSTVQRIVQALDHENLVIAASLASGVRLGPALLALAASVKQFSIVEYAHPLLAQLSKDTGETVDLAILGNDKAVIVDTMYSTYPLVAVSGLGSSRPLHSSASGKALLAALPRERYDQLKKHLCLSAVTRNTITDWHTFDREIETVRHTGMAFDDEEYALGISALSVAVHGPGDEFAAIAMPVPTERFRETKDRLAKALVERAKTFERCL